MELATYESPATGGWLWIYIAVSLVVLIVYPDIAVGLTMHKEYATTEEVPSDALATDRVDQSRLWR